MKKTNTYRTWSAVMLAIVALLTGCSEGTDMLGIYPQGDAINTSTASFGILSSDMLNANVPAGSTTCYLGKVIDPETDEAISATFAAQFHTFEGYSFPDKEDIVRTADGHLCESIEVRLFIKNTFGDKNNPMKVEVWPLSKEKDKLLEESAELFTNTDLWQYVDQSEGPLATKVFTATDYAMSDAERASQSYSNNVRIVLPREYGENIMETFYSDPSAFRDSYSFIRKACAGLLFRTVSGSGTMLNLEVSTINLTFRYTSEALPDSIISGICRFAATPEVIQSTQFESTNLTGLIGNDNYTMLKTPAGICTELELPINDIYKGHENDSIIRASVTLTRLNNQDEDALNDDYALGIPKELLLVRKQNLSEFFANHRVSDSQQSYTTSFVPTYNSYTFANISRLISYCRNEKVAGMKQTGMSEEEWIAAHPDWNRVVLVPVTVSSATDSYGISSQVSVNQDLSLCSTKLVRGTEANPIKMQVIYSHFVGQ